MWLQHLDIQGIRNIHHSVLKPCNGLNLITGVNGSGKSSILEAIHCLSTGRSFRTHRKHPLIQNGLDVATVYAEISQGSNVHHVAIQKRRDGSSLIRVNGRNQENQLELAQLLPVVGTTPESDDFFSDGVKVRQSYLDWTLFHVEPAFREAWRNYRRALQQRNSALRSRSEERMVTTWDDALVHYGTQVDIYRKQALTRLLPIITNLVNNIAPSLKITFSLRQGWPKEETLKAAYRQTLTADRKMGFTHSGPHRADLTIKTPDGPVSLTCSRGQKKILTILLKLAQVWDYSVNKGTPPILYIDDLAAELDASNRTNILNVLTDFKCQVFITATSLDDILASVTTHIKVFHVEQGSITSVV